MSDYLLLKITALEHASANDNCRVAEDILSVICDPPPSPTPTSTVTVTPTNTTTSTNTPTITSTVSLTPTITQTSTATPTVTPTSTVTPTITPTNTVTPTITPTSSTTPTITPTSSITPTITPTSSLAFISTLTIPSSSNYISDNGLTFVASLGDSLSYTPQTGSDLPSTMNISISGVVKSSVIFPNSIYSGKPFRFTVNLTSKSYTGNFVSGNINFN